MKYPILKNKQSNHPSNLLCPTCKKRKVGEPHSMVILSGGACLMDKKRTSGGPHPNMDAFFSIAWHGAHGYGVGKNRDKYHTVDIVHDVRGGQFEFYFCSTKCLRKWISQIINDFEAKIK